MNKEKQDKIFELIDKIESLVKNTKEHDQSFDSLNEKIEINNQLLLLILDKLNQM